MVAPRVNNLLALLLSSPPPRQFMPPLIANCLLIRYYVRIFSVEKDLLAVNRVLRSPAADSSLLRSAGRSVITSFSVYSQLFRPDLIKLSSPLYANQNNGEGRLPFILYIKAQIRHSIPTHNPHGERGEGEEAVRMINWARLDWRLASDEKNSRHK